MGVIIASNILQAKEGFNVLMSVFFFSRKEREELSLSSVRETHENYQLRRFGFLNMCIRVQYQCSVFLCGILDRRFSLHVFERS